MRKHEITTQKEIRQRFWEDHPTLSRKKIKDHSGKGTMYCVDTRCAFVDYVDNLERCNQISRELAYRVTL